MEEHSACQISCHVFQYILIFVDDYKFCLWWSTLSILHVTLSEAKGLQDSSVASLPQNDTRVNGKRDVIDVRIVT